MEYSLQNPSIFDGVAEQHFATGTDGRPLCVQMLHPNLPATDASLQRLQRLPKFYGSLDHRNIVRIYEMTEKDGGLTIVNEFFGGVSLTRLLQACVERGATIAPSVAVHIATEVARALHFAHMLPKPVFHADLTPRHILLSDEGEIKLAGFGIATPHARDFATQVGALPQRSYKSPEETRGEPLDITCNIYSLGVILQEMLGLTWDAEAEQLRAAEGHADEIDGDLLRIVGRMLRRDMSQRFRTANEVVRLLQDYLTSRHSYFTLEAAADFFRNMLAPEFAALPKITNRGSYIQTPAASTQFSEKPEHGFVEKNTASGNRAAPMEKKEDSYGEGTPARMKEYSVLVPHIQNDSEEKVQTPDLQFTLRKGRDLTLTDERPPIQAVKPRPSQFARPRAYIPRQTVRHRRKSGGTWQRLFLFLIALSLGILVLRHFKGEAWLLSLLPNRTSGGEAHEP